MVGFFGGAMRILFALDSYRPNIDGVGISVERQALGLARRGHDVAILAPGQKFANYEDRVADDLKVFRVRSVKLVLDRWRLAILPSGPIEHFIDELSPDVVVVSLPFPLNSAALSASRKHGIPIVGITGTMPEWLIYNIGILKPFAGAIRSRLWRIIARFYNRCDSVVAVTPTAMHFLEDNGLERPVRVISNGVDLQQFKPRNFDRELAARLGVPTKPTVLYAGRLDSEKCMDVWLKAVPHVLHTIDAHFLVVGDGSEKPRLTALASKLGVEDHVTFAGFLNYADYRHAYSLGSVFAISSPAELQSIVTLEAAASGLPIVGVNAGALPELVRDGLNGYLFEEGNETVMAEKLILLLGDSRKLKTMGQESRRIASNHDLNVSIEKYEHLYRSVKAA
jgi:glycosyltransferase involved in cell wall biosynthesis